MSSTVSEKFRLSIQLSAVTFAVCLAGYSQAQDAGSIQLNLEPDKAHSYADVVLDTDAVTGSFDMAVESADMGKVADLFMVAQIADSWYLRGFFGWEQWTGNPADLKPFAEVTLDSEVRFQMFSNEILAAGDYRIWGAYAVEGEELTIASEPASFSINSSTADTLHRFSSPEAMEAYLKEGMSNGSNSANLIALETFSTAADSVAAGGTTASRVSSTNVQEVGVDEADIIKTDGEYLYALRTCGSDTCVAAFELDETAPAAEEVGLYQPENDENFNSANSMYLIEDSPTGSDMLVTLSGSNYYIAWLDFWGWQGNELELEFIDAGNPTNLQLIEKLTIDGSLISSRRIGDQLYVVSRYTPGFEGFVPYAFDDATRLANSDALETATLSTLLPQVEMSGENVRDLIESKDCYIATNSVDENNNPSIITVTSIPLSDPADFQSTCFLGNTETVYMTTEALYLATTQYDYQLLARDSLFYDPEHTTSIHKFDLNNIGVTYAGSGEVRGHLGWSEDKRSFRMGTGGDNGEYLNVVTSIGSTWNDTSSTRLTVLKDEGDLLNEVDVIDGIGKPGEQLFAARFVGERAYLVTFQVIDPLYVVDLSDQENPRITGELEIEGYSDYLHPVNENLILGFGKDAIPDDGSSVFGNIRGAWFQGVKVSLFDVSDPGNPFEVNALVYGKRGSESEVLYDHHGISFLPASGDKPFRFAIPIQVNDTEPDWEAFDPDSPSAWYSVTSKGLYSFEVTDDGVRETDYIEGFTADTLDFATFSYFADRSVLTDNAVFYVNQGTVLSAPVE